MTLTVAFYKGRKRLFNRLVSWYLRGAYSHCELVTRTDENGVSDCISSSFMDGGVRLKRMRLDPAHWDLVEVDGDPRKVHYWLDMHEGDGYDVLGLLGFVWRRQKGYQDKWFCSEAVAEALGMQESWRFDPMTLWAALSKRSQI